MYEPNKQHTDEEWRPVQGYEGLYKVSNYGRVFSERNKLIMSPVEDAYGYLTIKFKVSGKHKKFLVHRLVAITFIENPKDKPQVNHLDGNKKNNYCNNLEWCTSSENIKHAFAIGLKCNKGEKGPSSKVTEEQVKEIRTKKENGARNIDLMKEYGLSGSNIKLIINRTTWNHI